MYGVRQAPPPRLRDTGMRVGELIRLRTDDQVTPHRKNFLHVRG